MFEINTEQGKENRKRFLLDRSLHVQDNKYQISHEIKEEVVRRLSEQECIMGLLKQEHDKLSRKTPGGTKIHDYSNIRNYISGHLELTQAGKLPGCPITLAENHPKYYESLVRKLAVARQIFR